jgi:hypothetical protein
MNSAVSGSFGDQSRVFYAIVRLSLRCTTAVEFSSDFKLRECWIARYRHSAVGAINEQLSTVGDRCIGDDGNAAVIGVSNNAVCNGDASGDGKHRAYQCRSPRKGGK